MGKGELNQFISDLKTGLIQAGILGFMYPHAGELR